ncbi:hypothetical protein Gogos_012837 [Gossypium gossypioides]|uniref:Uncharacterized protein n=1 Tax=Gossypium gossypioides TaxID=34282 RepID=A0A7J9BTR3_GOSGO|nr:hypothetical protein [Gossypium gossypioides]
MKPRAWWIVLGIRHLGMLKVPSLLGLFYQIKEMRAWSPFGALTVTLIQLLIAQ